MMERPTAQSSTVFFLFHHVQTFKANILLCIYRYIPYSTLSQVIHAVAALLYPFTWQHTFISIVPKVLIDVVMAPTPYLLGVTRNMLDLVTDQSDDADVSRLSVLPNAYTL